MKTLAVRSPLCAALERSVRDRARDLAIRHEPEGLSLRFEELGARIEAWAARLEAAGLGEASAVALAAGNTPAFVELFFALRGLGLPVITLDESLPAEAAAAVAAKMGASWLIRRDGVEGAGPDPRVRWTPLRAEAEPPSGTALVKLTSGSTLAPRGACFTEAALLEGIRHILEGMELRASDRILLSIPLSHSYGFDNGVLSLAAGGTALVLQPDVMPAALLRSMREHEVSVFPSVPALIRALGGVAWPPLPALRKVLCASAPLSAEAASAFRLASGLPVHQFFGATESGGISFETRPEEAEAAGSVGFPLPGLRVEIDPVAGVRIHSAANRFAVLPAQPVPAWVETGDRAEWSAEGRLRLTGRATLTANVGGHKVDLGAMDAFFRGLRGVDDAAAVAVEDPARGHRVVACVETASLTATDLLRICRERLGSREIPHEIRVMERLPRNARGKLDRPAIAALAGGAR